MRIATFLILSSFAAAAFGFPAIGDMAEFEGWRYPKKGKKQYMYSKAEIFDYVANTKMFLQREEFYGNGNNSTITGFVEANRFLTRAQVLETLRTCAAEARSQVVVNAGKFETCAVKFEDETSHYKVYMADVPYGAVKSEAHGKIDGSKTVMELQKFNVGKE